MNINGKDNNTKGKPMNIDKQTIWINENKPTINEQIMKINEQTMKINEFVPRPRSLQKLKKQFVFEYFGALEGFETEIQKKLREKQWKS